MPPLRPLTIWLPVAALLSIVAVANVLTGYRLEWVFVVLLPVICLCLPATFATFWRTTDARIVGNRIIEATMFGELMLVLTLLYAATHTNPAVHSWSTTLLLFLTAYIPLLIGCPLFVAIRKALLLKALPKPRLALVWTVALLPIVLHGLFVLRLAFRW